MFAETVIPLLASVQVGVAGRYDDLVHGLSFPVPVITVRRSCDREEPLEVDTALQCRSLAVHQFADALRAEGQELV